MSKRGGIFGAFREIFTPKAHKGFIPLPYVKNLHSLEQCKVCDGACATHCPENIILKNTQHSSMPYLNFMLGGCTFCGDCALACQNLYGTQSVLDLSLPHLIDAKVSINPLSCLAWQKTSCMSCKDACKENAICFSGGLYPEVDSQVCTACGLCYARCPAFCIEIESIIR